jgi:serine/threonine-protein kinase PpkA
MRIPGYVIQRTIGKGEMATVYLAEQESLQRLVALKTLRLEFEQEDPEDTVHDRDELAKSARFVNEGRLVASLQHPHVVQIYDIGATPEVMYISMEYVAGGDLQSRLDAPLPVAVALDILLEIGLALETAHRRGTIHRDVKPGNILVRADDTPLLSGFGIAKQVDEQLELTSTRARFG